MNRQPKIACIGMVTIDFLRVTETYPRENSENSVIKSLDVIGGSIGRGAITAARLGAETHILATCGDDLFAQVMQDMVNNEGIIANWVVKKKWPTQHSFILISANNGNRTTNWLPQPKADEEIISQLPSFIKGCGCILMDCTDENISHAVAEEAPKQNIPTVLDTGAYKPWVEDLLHKVSHPISPKNFFEQRNPKLSPRDALHEAFEKFKPVVWGMTEAGSDGTYITNCRPNFLQSFSASNVAVVDTCGAGDTFHGAFAYAISRHLPIENAFKLSSWAAGRKCKKLGNSGIPYSHEIPVSLRSKSLERLATNKLQ